MDSKISVSVAIATFNGERYLRKQLDSIYNQTVMPAEVIVCDDGSKDDTIEILEEYKQNFNLVYYKNERNLGFYRNFEKAISKCTGDYIALADQDDIWMPNKIERLLNEIGNYSLICTDANLIDFSGKMIHISYFEYQNLYPYYPDSFLNLIFNNYVTGCTVLFKKELLQIALPMPDLKYHDQWLGLVASKNGGIKFLNEQLIKYRQHEKNDTGSHKFINWYEKISNLTVLLTDKEEFISNRNIVIDSIQNILNSGLNLSSSDMLTLRHTLVYYKNRRRFLINPICVYYGLKYNRLYYGYYGIFYKRMLAALGTILF